MPQGIRKYHSTDYAAREGGAFIVALTDPVIIRLKNCEGASVTGIRRMMSLVFPAGFKDTAKPSE